MDFPNYNYSSAAPNPLGVNPFKLAIDPNFRINLNGISTTTTTAGAPGNLNGVNDYYQKVMKVLSDPSFQGLSETVQGSLLGNPNLFGGNQFDLGSAIEKSIESQERQAEKFLNARREEAELANEMGRDNLILASLLKMPGQISDSWARAATAGLPYQQEARQMMANAGANLQRGFESLTNANTQFGNQINNLYSNAAAYRPTIVPLAGKYFA